MTGRRHGRERSFDDLVAALTPQVLDEAVRQAAEQAREELAARLTRAIVDRALEGVRSAPSSVASSPAGAPAPATGTPVAPEPPREARPSPPPSRPRRAHTAEETGLYAFAIMQARPVDLAGVVGIDGEAPLHIVQHGDLGLVVSRMRLALMDDVSEDDLSETGALATLARRHDEVVRAVFEHGPVLPLRFGTVVADEAAGVRLLQEHEPEARRRLAHLSGNREWGVRLVRDAEAAESSQREETLDRRRMTGASYLAARREALQRAQQAEQHAAALSDRVQRALREHAADAVHRGGGPGSDVLADVAYLVPQTGEEDFLAAVQRLNAEVAHEHLELSVTGPWPPYSFASLQHASGGGVVGSA